MLENNFKIVGGDTDSIMFCKPDMSPFPKEEQELLLQKINSLLPGKIKFKNDGIFTKVLYLKSKNYCMIDEKGKRKIKGSSLKSATLEPQLKKFLNEMIDNIMIDKLDQLPNIYRKYQLEIENITDITPWCKKVSLSTKTYNSPRKNEKDIIDAIVGKEYVVGDKVYVFTKMKTIELEETYKVGVKKGQKKTKEVKYLCLKEDFKGEFDKETYLGKLESCLNRFETIQEIMELFK